MRQEVEMTNDQLTTNTNIEIIQISYKMKLKFITFAIALSYVRTLSISDTANGYKTLA